MNTNTTRRTFLGACLWLVPLLSAGPLAVAVQAQSGNNGWALVDCDKEPPGALQRAIDRAQAGNGIQIRGTCAENVVVTAGKNLLTLEGGGSGTISGPDANLNVLQVRGPIGVTIHGLRITGGRAGIDISRGSSAVIDGNVIEFTGRNGITLGAFATANIVNNVIRNNAAAGILLTGNAFGFIGFRTADDPIASPNTIRANGTHGISVTLSSSARIAGNVISDNLRNGINVDRVSQANISDNDIDANGQSGIFVTENSGVDLGIDSGNGLFDAPNRTMLNNVLRGITCRVGGYANGRTGTLNGAGGVKDIGSSCIDTLNVPDSF